MYEGNFWREGLIGFDGTQYSYDSALFCCTRLNTPVGSLLC